MKCGTRKRALKYFNEEIHSNAYLKHLKYKKLTQFYHDDKVFITEKLFFADIKICAFLSKLDKIHTTQK